MIQCRQDGAARRMEIGRRTTSDSTHMNVDVAKSALLRKERLRPLSLYMRIHTAIA